MQSEFESMFANEKLVESESENDAESSGDEEEQSESEPESEDNSEQNTDDDWSPSDDESTTTNDSIEFAQANIVPAEQDENAFDGEMLSAEIEDELFRSDIDSFFNANEDIQFESNLGHVDLPQTLSDNDKDDCVW